LLKYYLQTELLVSTSDMWTDFF